MTDSTTEPTPSRVSPRVRLALSVAFGALALHAVTGAVLVPWLVRHQVPALARNRLHRSATLAGMRFNPYTLKATLVGLDLRDRDGTPLLSFDTLVADFAAASVVRRATVLDEFRVVRPRGVFRLLADGRPAIADLLPADSAVAAGPDAPPRLVVGHAALRDGAFDFVDESRRPRYEEHFSDLDLALERISTLPQEDGTHVLTAEFSTGARVRWTGKEAFQPLRLDGTLQVDSALVPRWSEVFARDLPLQLTEGRLYASVPYHVEQDARGAFQVVLQDMGLQLRAVAARERGDSADLFRAAGVRVGSVAVRWPDRVATVARIEVDSPWTAVAREADGRMSWEPLLAGLNAADTTASGSGWAVQVDSVLVRDGIVEIADRTTTPTLALVARPVTLALAGVSTDSTRRVGVRAAATLDGRTTLSLDGTLTPAPLAGTFVVGADAVDLRLAQRYLGAHAAATITAGTASAKGTVTVGRRPSLAFDGSALVRGMAVKDSAGEPLLAWRALEVQGVHYTAAPDMLRIRRMRFEQPFARIAISKEREINLMQVAASLPQDTAAAAALPYEIGEMRFTDGRLDFSDESLLLPFRTDVDSVTASIRDVASFGGTPGTLELEGSVDTTGLARANGTLHVNDPYAATDVRAEFRNLDLSHFTPYSATFAGYAIRSGRLDVDMHYRVLEKALTADHHIVAKDLQLGGKVEGGESPGFLVKLAISLMKDKDGRITLDVPVTGTVDDPQFSYKGIVWQAMKQMLGKIATAPFRFLGKLFGGGGDDAELVDFDPGRSDLIPPEKVKMDSLAAELGRKPDLVLKIEGRYDSVSDGQALREAKVEAMLAQRRDSLFKGRKADDTTSTVLGRTLESLYAEQFSPAGLDSLRDSLKVAYRDAASDGRKLRRGYESPTYFSLLRSRMVAKQAASPEELVQLARDRSAAMVSALAAAGLTDSSRLEVLAPALVKRKKQGSPRIASELAMDAK